jgi:phytol kinase
VTDALSATLVLVILSGLMGAVRFWQHRRSVHPELSRKALHIGMGVITLAFPWLFQSSLSVFLLALTSASALVTVRIVPHLGKVGDVLHRVGRKSFGEIYFPFGVALLFFASGGDPMLYWPPLLLLTFADSIAALTGIAFGRLHYTTDDGAKTVEGSVAFFVTAFAATAVSLGMWSTLDWEIVLLVSLLFGMIGVLLEAVAWRGLDNLFIPVLGFLFLDAFLILEPFNLIWRLALLGALLLFAFSRKRRTTLNDSALLGVALFGYLSLVVGGILWTLPPLLLFLFYPRLVPYFPDSRANVQPAAGVLAVAGPGLFWLLLHRLSHDPSYLLPYTFTFAAHLGIIWVARWLEGGHRVSACRLLRHAGLPTVLIVVLPLGAGMERSGGLFLYFIAALLATAVTCHLSARHFCLQSSGGQPVPACWFFRGGLVFALSLGLHLAIDLWLQITASPVQ